MKMQTPFFHGFNQVLFGRQPVSTQERITREIDKVKAASLSGLARLFEGYLEPSLFRPPADYGPNSRRRHFSLATTFWAFLAQVLNPGSSCREAVRQVQAMLAAQGAAALPAGNTSAFCQARGRLCAKWLSAIFEKLGEALRSRLTSDQLWCGRRVLVIDGTGVSMPDTAANQSAWPQQKSQMPGCAFPVAGLVGCFCLGSAALLRVVVCRWQDHEALVWRRLWDFFEARDVVLADRAYCSFGSMAALSQRGIDLVLRLHQRREADFRKGRRIGKDQRLIVWEKPQCLKSWSAQAWAALPKEITLRMVRLRVAEPGFRTREIILVTTLLDHDAIALEDLGELYRRRWEVELFFRDIKTSLAMDVLRCHSPEMVQKEIFMHAIAYNLIRLLMHQAAITYSCALGRLSFKGALDTIRQVAAQLSAPKLSDRNTRLMIKALVAIIASDLIPMRPNRVEPRAKKRRPKNYILLNRPRHKMVAPPHRNRPPKHPKAALS